jgi:hypothetical protein
MGSVQLQLNGTTPVTSVLPVDSGRITVEVMSDASGATVYCTLDGSAPVIPSATVNNTGQIEIAGAVGQFGELEVPEFGDHMAYPTFQAASLGSPLIEVTW